MKILIVCSGNYPDPEINFSKRKAFIYDQAESLREHCDINYEVFFIKGRNLKGYIRNRKQLKEKIRNGEYDLLHAHYGLSGFLAVISTRLPVVVTFHGSDVNNVAVRLISQVVLILSKHSVFVTEKLRRKMFFFSRRSSVIPCGINLEKFYPEDPVECRRKENLSKDKKYILFASDFSNPVKNYPLAQQAVKLLNSEVKVIDLKDRSREEVRTVLNSADVLLMTSFSEGSPQIIKEAMACNCPIVSTDVGDVRNIIGSARNCYISEGKPGEIAFYLKKVLAEGVRSDGRIYITWLDNKIIAGKIYSIYKEISDYN